MNMFFLLLTAVCVLVSVQPAHAYIGPGIGAGTVGVLLGIVASVFLALFAVIWYPVKRLFKAMKEGSRDLADP